MYSLYSLLLTVGFIALLPRFAIDAMRSGKYVTGLGQRLGKLPFPNTTGQPLIWLHCVSVGETRAAEPLVRALSTQFPEHLLVISTTTVTGQQVARSLFPNDAALVFYFPIDLALVVRRVLRTLRPSVILIMETELWPRLLHECRARAIPVALLNGRISSKSFKRYRKIKPFMRRVLNDLTIAIMQSDDDAARIRELGLAPERIALSGNLKFDSASALDDRVAAELRARFGFDGVAPLVIAASTHPSEERTVIYAFKSVKLKHPHARLLIAPRHPERFEEVAAEIESSGLSWSRRSSPPSKHNVTCDIILLDTIGELRSVYTLAEIVFVAGSITSHGGHNMLEPASAGVCVVTGPHTENFSAITKTMLAKDALIQISEESATDFAHSLATVITQLLSNEEMCRTLGRNALAVCRENFGATARTMELLSESVIPKSTVSDPSPKLSALKVTTAE